jgi:hypothetical protein
VFPLFVHSPLFLKTFFFVEASNSLYIYKYICISSNSIFIELLNSMYYIYLLIASCYKNNALLMGDQTISRFSCPTKYEHIHRRLNRTSDQYRLTQRLRRVSSRLHYHPFVLWVPLQLRLPFRHSSLLHALARQTELAVLRHILNIVSWSLIIFCWNQNCPPRRSQQFSNNGIEKDYTIRCLTSYDMLLMCKA